MLMYILNFSLSYWIRILFFEVLILNSKLATLKTLKCLYNYMSNFNSKSKNNFDESLRHLIFCNFDVK